MQKSLFSATALCVAVIATSATAQMTGSRPGLFDVTAIQGWSQIPATDPSVRQWAHNASATSAGTNCNIVTTAVPVSNDDYQAIFRSISEAELLGQMRAAGGSDFTEISPVQSFDFDGTDAFRLTSRFSYQGVNLTAIQAQAVISGNAISVTCGTVEAAVGQLLPTLERFIDTIRFGSGFVSAKIEREPGADYPALLPAGNPDNAGVAMTLSQKSLDLFAERAIAE